MNDKIEQINSMGKLVSDLKDVLPIEGSMNCFHSQQCRDKAVRCHDQVDLRLVMVA